MELTCFCPCLSTKAILVEFAPYVYITAQLLPSDLLFPPPRLPWISSVRQDDSADPYLTYFPAVCLPLVGSWDLSPVCLESLIPFAVGCPTKVKPEGSQEARICPRCHNGASSDS